MEAQDVIYVGATRSAQGVGNQDKETNGYDIQGLGRYGCESSQHHLAVSRR
jgi:hypothetical protein